MALGIELDKPWELEFSERVWVFCNQVALAERTPPASLNETRDKHHDRHHDEQEAFSSPHRGPFLKPRLEALMDY